MFPMEPIICWSCSNHGGVNGDDSYTCIPSRDKNATHLRHATLNKHGETTECLATILLTRALSELSECRVKNVHIQELDQARSHMQSRRKADAKALANYHNLGPAPEGPHRHSHASPCSGFYVDRY